MRTIGGHRTDEPGGTWPNVSMKWMPVYTADCTFCGDRQADGLEPYCAYNCPTEAMTFGDLDDSSSAISLRMKELEGKGYRIFQLPKHEKTRSEIYYAERM
ncbi:MAG: 4Fe-4S dicluster domain-containing protein [Coriobacteriia bacterium]